MDHVLWCNKHPLLLPDIVKGEGCYLYDLQGQKYLDLESGIWCLPLGHCHPQINAVMGAQAGILAHSGYCYANEAMEQASSAVLDLLSMPDGKCVFLSSGSEAVEFGVVGRPLQRVLEADGARPVQVEQGLVHSLHPQLTAGLDDGLDLV